MAQPTMQSVIDMARMTLNDDDKARDTDADLLVYANTGLDEAYRLRPDLFMGSFASTALTEGHQKALADAFPIDARFRRAVADYIVGMAEVTDDEHQNSGRAGALLTKFEKGLSQ